MNPNYNDQNNQGEYRGKSIFDSQPNPQAGLGQLPPADPTPKKHTLVIILTVCVVVIILLAGLFIAINSAKKQATSSTPDQNALSQATQTQVDNSQKAAESFLNNAIANKLDKAKTQTSSQFQASVTDAQLKNLLATFSSYVGAKATFELNSKIDNTTIQFDNDDTSYAAASYVFSLKNTSDGTPFYIMVNVAQINNQWLIYGFQYNSEQIKPDINTNGRYEFSG